MAMRTLSMPDQAHVRRAWAWPHTAGGGLQESAHGFHGKGWVGHGASWHGADDGLSEIYCAWTLRQGWRIVAGRRLHQSRIALCGAPCVATPLATIWAFLLRLFILQVVCNAVSFCLGAALQGTSRPLPVGQFRVGVSQQHCRDQFGLHGAQHQSRFWQHTLPTALLGDTSTPQAVAAMLSRRVPAWPFAGYVTDSTALLSIPAGPVQKTSAASLGLRASGALLAHGSFQQWWDPWAMRVAVLCTQSAVSRAAGCLGRGDTGQFSWHHFWLGLQRYMCVIFRAFLAQPCLVSP